MTSAAVQPALNALKVLSASVNGSCNNKTPLDWLYRRIAKLNEVDRDRFLALLILDGFSCRDMAEILGLTENHVGVKINGTSRRWSTGQWRRDTMNFDDLLGAWRFQDDAQLYNADYGRLREALQRERVNTRRSLRSEAWRTYGMSAALFAGLAFVFLLMAYDGDPRTVWDFVIVILGAAGALLWGAQLYVSRRIQARRERRFGISLRDDIGRHLVLLEYQMSRLWRVSSVLLSTLPLFCCVFVLWIALGLINKEPVQDWNWMVGSAVFVGMIMMMVYEFTSARRAAEQEILPLKRRLEALLERLQVQ